MSKQNTIITEAQLSEAVRVLWAQDTALNWRRKKWEPRRERGIDAIGELVLAKQKRPHPLLLIAPNISATLARLCRERGLSCAPLTAKWTNVQQ